VEVTVDAKGKVEAIKAISGHRLLQQAAVDCVKQWKFRATGKQYTGVLVVPVVLKKEPPDGCHPTFRHVGYR
jgi:TonB family protein